MEAAAQVAIFAGIVGAPGLKASVQPMISDGSQPPVTIGFFRRREAQEERMAVTKPTATKARAPRKPVETDLGFSWGRSNNVLLGLGILALVAGYIALGRGSLTLAPVLLVGGYCVLIPASLLFRRRSEASGE